MQVNRPHPITPSKATGVALGLLLVFTAAPGCAKQLPRVIAPEMSSATLPPARSQDSVKIWSIRDYRLVRQEVQDPASYSPEDRFTYVRYELFHRGRKVFSRRNPSNGDDWIGPRKFKTTGRAAAGNILEADRDFARDITGDGVPNVILYWRSGGSCGCDVQVLALGKRFKDLGRFDGECRCPRFEDIDDDGSQEIIVPSHELRAWCDDEPPTDSPPRVIYKFTEGRYRPALAQMRQPSPSPKLLRTMATGINPRRFTQSYGQCCHAGGCAPIELWSRALALIHQGQASAAGRLVQLAWPKSRAGESAFRWALLSRLRRASKAYAILKKLNSHTIYAALSPQSAADGSLQAKRRATAGRAIATKAARGRAVKRNKASSIKRRARGARRSRRARRRSRSRSRRRRMKRSRSRSRRRMKRSRSQRRKKRHQRKRSRKNRRRPPAG